MKLQEGVHLHFIPTDQFTTNSIKIRFAAPMRRRLWQAAYWLLIY